MLKRREEISARREDRPVRTLSAADMLCGIDDTVRMGALRLKRDPKGPFLNESAALSVPLIASLRELAAAAAGIEESEYKQQLPQEKWLRELLLPGSSLGGARPKASVRDEAGKLWIAKFPSRNDEYDVGAWEHFAYVLARRAGIETAPSRIISMGGNHHAFLAERFDRVRDKRIHFASAMTLIGLTDGDGAATGRGYLDIVEAILEHCTDVEKNLEELYRRVAFNIALGNCDDHFRNHGFLLSRSGWRLSPAYDINPTQKTHQNLLINGSTDASDLNLLSQSAASYFLDQGRADTIIREVLKAMRSWPEVARKLGLARRDIDIFSDRFITEMP